MHKRNSHCSFCGQPFTPEMAWPRACGTCGNVSYLNPIPVAVVLLPVHDSVLLMRRGTEPRKGQLALPGGYVDHGETWQVAGARELKEETGITLLPEDLSVFDVISAADGTLLIFGAAKPRTASGLPRFTPTAEVTELVLASSPLELAFPTHTQVLKRYLALRQKQMRARRRTSQAEGSGVG
jgi:ADP-ribose pyrophosphatase YjhB (NUDIX family)